MRLSGLWSAISLFTAAAAQTISGLTFDSQDVVSIIWGFDGVLSAPYDLWLCAGDESTGEYETLVQVIKDVSYTSGDWVSFRVDQSVGGNDPNAYFLKIVPSNTDAPSGMTSHFTLTNMKGTFSTKVADAVKLMQPIPISLYMVDDSNLLDPPEATRSLNASQSTLEFPVPTSGDELDRHELRKRLAVDPHTIPYGEQMGRTKYAPMPKRAGSTIANKPATPQYPPFPFSIATTYLPAPTVDYTDTAYATWTTHSIENTAAPAAMPTLDKRMQDWMERRNI
ncbi:hypothetical protein N7520_000364 [Penicillium odoratum]|uniref:uncharacterized protein n=1 Tax=Penicillium odoratum TaxID=1167516 RepID=UPI00254759D6|nr:uncharacterized protein N7520_000364 [Penicillium odoratum]KAJ5777118.1 hypothetical protein N7520_000364 [Penicillium odoratum]